MKPFILIYKNNEIKKEWTGLRVCKDCWEPRHPSDFQKGVKDDPSVPYTRPEQADSGGTDILGNAFTPAENTAVTEVGIEPDDELQTFPDSWPPADP